MVIEEFPNQLETEILDTRVSKKKLSNEATDNDGNLAKYDPMTTRDTRVSRQKTRLI
jgi:hypothetical protein